MSFVAKRNTEPIWFEIFVKNAIAGDQRYIDIVKPILLDAGNCANKKISIYKLDRKGLEIKLYLLKWELLKDVTEDNLYLVELLNLIQGDEDYYNMI